MPVQRVVGEVSPAVVPQTQLSAACWAKAVDAHFFAGVQRENHGLESGGGMRHDLVGDASENAVQEDVIVAPVCLLHGLADALQATQVAGFGAVVVVGLVTRDVAKPWIPPAEPAALDRGLVQEQAHWLRRLFHFRHVPIHVHEAGVCASSNVQSESAAILALIVRPRGRAIDADDEVMRVNNWAESGVEQVLRGAHNSARLPVLQALTVASSQLLNWV
mmetsp:Transcript_46714/g.107999  ORF Transcript_46714/g.107999 Transcript_46714/m.107999 type:complete len:219 (-) Transcript_46714:491-1147(-)